MQLSRDLREFVELLNSNGIEYLVVGGFAVAWHGYARFTADMDLLVRPDRSNAERVVKALRDFGFSSLGISEEDLTHPGRIVQLGVKPNRIDLITSIAGVTFEEAWASRVAGALEGLQVTYIGRDARILNKESTVRPQDIGDAQRLSKRQPRQ
jgi:hypothetical protein